MHDDGGAGDDYTHRNGYANGGTNHQPSARAAANRSRATVAAAAADDFDFDPDGQTYEEDALEDPGDIQGDPEEKTYCYCNRISFGQMVGCDDDNCDKEWVRLIH